MTTNPKNHDHAATLSLPGLAPWVGGKRNLARTIAERIARVPHGCYAEPFIGMGGVFFRRRTRPRAEAINDLGGDVYNLFRIVQRHPEALLGQLRWSLASRQTFEELHARDPKTLTDVERAAKFFVLQHLGFGGRVGSRSFATAAEQGKGRDPGVVMSRIRRAHDRLAKVTVENLPWDEFVRRYDRPITLFYLDPPYWGLETLYGKGLFKREDFEAMAELLGRLQGRFILSLNDRPEVRRIFRRFKIETVETTYRPRGGAKKVTEVLISGGGGGRP